MKNINTVSVDDFLSLPASRYLSVAEAARFLTGLPQRKRGLTYQQTTALNAMKELLRRAARRGELSLEMRADRMAVRCSDLKAWARQHRNPSYRRELGLGSARRDVVVAVSSVYANASAGDVGVVAGGPGYPHDEIVAYRREIMTLRQKLAQREQRCAVLEEDAAIGRRMREAGRVNGHLALGVRKPSRKR